MENPKNLKPAVHGWLVLDKPLGLTSTQALGKARRLMGGKKVGHVGTLDPLATGVLPLAFGEATKTIPFMQESPKEYVFTVRWGIKTETDDAEGTIVAQSALRPSLSDIKTSLGRFTGVLVQKPPVYSAIKINGERAYALARAGQAPDMPLREVEVSVFELVDIVNEEHAVFRVQCGPGTYVRALARDLAESLGTYGHLTALRRTRAGRFTLENAFPLEKLEELSHKGAANTALLDIGAALDDIPGLPLSASEAQRLRAGQGLAIRQDHLHLMDAPIILASHKGCPVALIQAQAGAFDVVRGFNF